MGQNVSLLGADYPDVPAVQLPKTGGGTAVFYDITTQVLYDDGGVYISKSGNVVVIELMGYNWDGSTEISIPAGARNSRQIEAGCYAYADRSKRLSIVKKTTNTITFLDIGTGGVAAACSNIRGTLVYTV